LIVLTINYLVIFDYFVEINVLHVVSRT